MSALSVVCGVVLVGLIMVLVGGSRFASPRKLIERGVAGEVQLYGYACILGGMIMLCGGGSPHVVMMPADAVQLSTITVGNPRTIGSNR